MIEQFDNQDRHEFDDQMALEVHSMKEHLFTLLGKIQVSWIKTNGRSNDSDSIFSSLVVIR